MGEKELRKVKCAQPKRKLRAFLFFTSFFMPRKSKLEGTESG